MKTLFEYKAYRKVFRLNAEQCNTAFIIAMSMALLKKSHA